jgi:hypothetical protein
MRVGVVAMALAVVLVAGAARAADDDAPVCKRAEVNPVTGHVLCVDPLGAAVAPPPKADPCKADAHSGEDWTWRPSCTETKGS